MIWLLVRIPAPGGPSIPGGSMAVEAGRVGPAEGKGGPADIGVRPADIGVVGADATSDGTRFDRTRIGGFWEGPFPRSAADAGRAGGGPEGM